MHGVRPLTRGKQAMSGAVIDLIEKGVIVLSARSAKKARLEADGGAGAAAVTGTAMA